MSTLTQSLHYSGTRDNARKFIITAAIRNDNARLVYVCSTVNQIQVAAWNQILDLMPLSQVDRIVKSQLRVHLKNGSIIYFMSVSQRVGLEGMQLDGLVVDVNRTINASKFINNASLCLIHRNGWTWNIL